MTKNKIPKEAMIYLLMVPPIEELSDEFVDVVSQFRAGVLDQESACSYMEQFKNKLILNWISENVKINMEIFSENIC